MKNLFPILFSLFLPIFGFAQNHVPENGEALLYGPLDLSTAASWSTARSATPGKFSFAGAAAFKEAGQPITLTSTPTHWVNGYEKHYPNSGNTAHVYVVGSNTASMLLSTANEVAGTNIAVAWIAGNPSSVSDPTAPNSGLHPTSGTSQSGSTIKSVSTIGQWDWVGSYSGNVSVTVKLPATFSASNLRLVGWNGSLWIPLGTTGAVSGLLSGSVPATITAIAIGSTTVISNFRTAEMAAEIPTEIANTITVWPNPVGNGTVTIAYSIPEKHRGFLLLYDPSGKLCLRQKIAISKGPNKNNLDMQAFPSGTYFLVVADAENNPLAKPQRIIKL